VALIDREGRFELPRVPLGDWIVTVEPEGFERRSVRVTVARTAPATEVEIHTVTAHPSVLAIDVQDEFGVHAGAEHSAIDANARFALRVVLLDACPELGANLPEKPRELKCENRSAPGGATGPWLTVTFAQPTAGCACAVIGTRVLDVVPFAAGQAGLVLRVSAERLKRERIPLSIVVRDLEGNGPLANATVKFEPRRGRQRVQQTDAQGFARVDDLLAGELTVRVELAGYASARMDTTLEAGRREETHLIQLARAFAIRGRTHSPVAAPERFMIQAFTLHEESGQLHVLTSQDFVVRDGEFALEGLPRGRYIVGIATPDATPDPARVLRGEFPGWVHVDLTRGDVSGVVLEVPQVVILHSGYMWRRESVEELEQRLRDRKVDR
jgi:hypothetical protein